MPIFDDFLWTKRRPRSKRVGPEESRAAHEGGGHAQGVGRASLPCGFLEASPTSTPSLVDCFRSKNNSPEGFIPFGLHLILLFFETLKQAKNNNFGLGLQLIG